MTVETEVAALTTAVDNLASAVNVSKATLDASVADAQSAQSAASASASTASGHATSAAASASAAALTASSLAGFDLDAIAATKAVTAVDVFVYDTSKDSDGGAWRKRTQGTSWYNETLNTATRGSRREFPAVAVIVAEVGTVTIYDGDDPDLPMWMVFNNGRKQIIYENENLISSVFALNGQVWIGSKATAGHVSYASFAGDIGGFITQIGYYPTVNIFNRNVSFSGLPSGNLIVNRIVNDVAMTVLPNAPIDPATGLPVPTIAVATDGGVSVITDSGAVYDLTASSLSKANHLSFFNQYLYFNYGTTSLFSGNPMYIDVSKITGDITNLTSSTDYILGHVFGFNSTLWWPAFMENSSRGGVLLESTYLARGQINGVTHMRFGEMPSIYSQDSMVAYTTSTYNTGWLPGAIKGAFLADTDDTDLVGGDIAINGAFDTDTVWNKQLGWTISGGVASVNSSAAGSTLIRQGTTVVGEQYRVTFDVTSHTSGQLKAAAGTAISVEYASGVGSYSFNVTANGYGGVGIYAAGSGVVASVDNVNIEKLDPDRSVNNKGLIVNGTVTRSPVATGAELVAYSGFSASNYLEQPYNSALDFGTGDFCVMGWARQTSSSFEVLLDRFSASGQRIYCQTSDSAAQSMKFVISDGVNTATAASALNVMPLNVWTFVLFRRVGPLIEVWKDAQIVASAPVGSVGSLSDPDATLYVGVNNDLTGLSNVSSLALLRISATAPTAEAIKKIYNDEKHLFVENAACTLAGTSDAVTALAHDSSTGLLHVGSSYGRSVFQGLRRVDAVAGAVTAAISAENGMVVQQ